MGRSFRFSEQNQRGRSLSCRRCRCPGTAALRTQPPPLPPREDFKPLSLCRSFTFEMKAYLQGEAMKSELQFRQVSFFFFCFSKEEEGSGRNAEGGLHMINLGQEPGVWRGRFPSPSHLDPARSILARAAPVFCCAFCTWGHLGALPSPTAGEFVSLWTERCPGSTDAGGSEFPRAAGCCACLLATTVQAKGELSASSAAHVRLLILTSALRASGQSTRVVPFPEHRLPGGLELGRSPSRDF